MPEKTVKPHLFSRLFLPMDIQIEEEELLIDCGIVKEEYIVQDADTPAGIKIESPTQEDIKETVQFVIEEVNEKRYKCDLCYESFHLLSELAKHKANHRLQTSFNCPECSKSFKKDFLLKRHIQRHTDQGLPCHLCGKILRNSEGLSLHLDRHTQRKYKCDYCELIFISFRYRNHHMKVDHVIPKPVKCPECLMEFKRKDLLTDHMTVHRDQADGVCDLCPLVFRIKSNLKKHLEAIHGKKPTDQPWTCIYCYKNYKATQYRRKHIYRKHRGLPTRIKDTPIECSICSKLFFYFDDYQQHALKHCAELRFECEKCGKKFCHKPNILQHVRSHIKDPQDSTKSSKYICPQCGRQCWDRYRYERHLIIHGDEKTFECNICKKKFKLDSYLKAHVRTHLDGPKIECKVCGALYKDVYNFNRHSKKHENGVKPVNSKKIRRKLKTSKETIDQLIDKNFFLCM